MTTATVNTACSFGPKTAAGKNMQVQVQEFAGVKVAEKQSFDPAFLSQQLLQNVRESANKVLGKNSQDTQALSSDN